MLTGGVELIEGKIDRGFGFLGDRIKGKVGGISGKFS